MSSKVEILFELHRG